MAQRRTVIGAFVVSVLVGVSVYGAISGGAVLLLVTLLLEGLFACFWLASATLGGWFVLGLTRVRTRTSLSLSLRLATAAGLGLGVIGLLTLGLGLGGWLNHWTATGLLVATAAPQLVRILRSSTRPDISGWLKGESSGGWWWLLAAPVAALVLTAAMVPPGILWKSADDPHPFDVLEYHLQVPREWYEAGRIVPLAHNAFSYFPMGAEVHDLLAMHLRGGPWEGMYVAQLMSVGFTLVAVVAVYGVCRTVRRSRGDDSAAVPVLAAVLTLAVPWVTLLSPVAYVEAAMLAYATLAIGWALVSPSASRGMALAGALAGFACGVKYTAVPMVLLAVPAATMVRRPKVVPLATFLVTGLVTFSPWLVRNSVWTHGNPVFPEAMRVLGHAHFSADQVDRWEKAHAPRPEQSSLAGRLSAAGSQIVVDWRYGYALFPAAILAAALTWRRAETRTLVIFLLLLAGIWLFATHLQSRFFVLAVPACALLLGLSELRRPIALVAAVAAVALPGFIRINSHFVPVAAAFGLTDFKGAMPESYVKLADEGRRIALAGQGNIFWHQVPMSRLRYRTVFDVDTTRSSDPIEPWIAPGRLPDEWLLVYPGELERFSRTYAHIRPPPPDMLGRPEPIVVPPATSPR